MLPARTLLRRTAAVAAAAALLAACGGTTTSTTAASQQDATTPAATGYPRTVTHDDAGLARPASQDVDGFAAEVGEEQIRQADADHIFVTSFSGGEAAKERFQRNPLWAQLSAVQAGNVHDVADEIWMTSVSVQGAHLVLDDLATTFNVDAARS